jgi:hypothetical protein
MAAMWLEQAAKRHRFDTRSATINAAGVGDEAEYWSRVRASLKGDPYFELPPVAAAKADQPR